MKKPAYGTRMLHTLSYFRGVLFQVPLPFPDIESMRGRTLAMSVRSLEVVDRAIRDAETSNREERAYPQSVVDAAVAASMENYALFSENQLEFSEYFAK